MEQTEEQNHASMAKKVIEIPETHSLPEASTFDEANLNPNLLDAIAKNGWTKPTPVQSLCLPYTIKGKDVAGFAQTGTGKTGVFLVSVAHKILNDRKKEKPENPGPKALILAPTRELSMQIAHDAESLLKSLDISILAVFGGVDYEKQANALGKDIDIVVATPGRLKDYFQKKILTLEHCQQFICDEADRMFDMGFIEDVEFFLDKLNDNTQKLLFSATTNEQVKELAFEYLEQPEYISVNPEVITPENISQNLVTCESKYKLPVILGLLQQESPACAIVFTNTKLVAEWLHYKLTKNGHDADLITGDLPQKKRINLIHKIKRGEIKFLIATDVASRGLHIAGVTHVFNFDLPDDPANYVHRIGRTARAGAKGIAYSFVCEDYGHNYEGIQEMLGDTMKLKSEWFNPEFLKIEDKAGNPFEDPNFKSTAIPKPRDNDRSRGRKPAGRGRPDNKDDNRKPRQGRKGQQRNDQNRSRGRDFDKKGPKHRGKKKHTKRHDHNKKQAVAVQPVQAKPTSTFGIVKKFFKALFGRK